MPFIFIFLVVSLMNSGAFANGKSGNGKRWSWMLSTGYFSQDFSGDSGADFSHVQHYLIEVDIAHRLGSFGLFGLGYVSVPGINFQKFKLTSAELGSYKLSYTQMLLFIGVQFHKIKFLLETGTETPSWTGTPNMGYQSKSSSLSGVRIMYLGLQNKTTTFPVWFRYLTKPQRDMEFSAYPKDTLVIKPGTEMDLGIGVQYEF